MFQNSTLAAATDEYDDEDVVIETESTISRTLRRALQEEDRALPSVQGYVLLLRDIHPEATEEDVMDFLLDLGTRPLDLRLPTEHATGLLKGYALVEYAYKDQADRIRQRFSKGLTFMGRRMRLEYCFISPPAISPRQHHK
jgi:RNA recognition motif-containing protein